MQQIEMREQKTRLSEADCCSLCEGPTRPDELEKRVESTVLDPKKGHKKEETLRATYTWIHPCTACEERFGPILAVEYGKRHRRYGIFFADKQGMSPEKKRIAFDFIRETSAVHAL